MTTTTLAVLIGEVIAEHADAHPHKIARLVAECTSPDDVHDFYVQALERMVTDMVRKSRNSALASPQGRSPKVEQRRSWWARILRERVHVGESKWKPLGECTVGDLDFCIEERHSQIEALQTQIGKYDTIRAAMLTHGATTVADLPEDAVTL